VKPVTQCNSAQASCANRVYGRGLFVIAPGARGSALGRRCWATWRPASTCGRENGWAAHVRGPRCADARCRSGPRSQVLFLYFPENRNAYLVLVMNPTSINRSKLRGCPKIVRLILLGSQKCHLSVSVVSSQLVIMMIGS